jgi:hypothetical protein
VRTRLRCVGAHPPHDRLQSSVGDDVLHCVDPFPGHRVQQREGCARILALLRAMATAAPNPHLRAGVTERHPRPTGHGNADAGAIAGESP